MITNSFDKFPNEPTGLMYEQFGKIGINPAVTSALSASDYTSSNFTTVGSTVAITSNSVVFSSTPTNADNGQYMQIDSLAESDTWSLNFKLNFSVHNTFDNVFLGFTNASSTWNTSNTYIRLQTQGGGYQRFTLGTRISGSNTESTSATNTALVNTDYWCTFSSDGSGTATFKAWTNSGRTGTADTTLTKTYTGVGTMNYIQHRTYASGDTNVWTGTVSEITATTKPTLTSPASTKVKQHFIEWFSGKQLPSYWTFTDIYATNSGAMVDEVGGGYKITTATGGGNPTCSISFNKSSSSGNSNSNVCQYNYKGSVFNTVMKVDSITSIEAKVGLKKNTTGNFNHSNATIFGSTTLTNWACFSGDESGRTAVESNIPLDTNWNNHKLTLQTSNILYDINGVLKVTKTDRLPTVENLQPQAQMVSLNTDAKSLSIRYMEVYNT